ncbi:hypothetical protein ACWCQ0_42860 [Streptomyces massasporeus]|uniref:hypothetical protein n=1 Tax=Streptomyces massasporeus TaxID=67324 RepID=UPI0033E91D4D
MALRGDHLHAAVGDGLLEAAGQVLAEVVVLEEDRTLGLRPIVLPAPADVSAFNSAAAFLARSALREL